MSDQFDFLTKPTNDRLRKEIVNICDSYSHPWDILAELCQNAVDAIHSHLRVYGEAVKKHEIYISIDAIERSIMIRDTGIGFACENFINLLAPHGTDKNPDDFNNIGQKGVGLTYVIFSSDKFSISSKSVEGSINGGINNAVLWKNRKIEDAPHFSSEMFECIKSSADQTFTEIYVKGVEDFFEEEEDIFYQSLLRYLNIFCALKQP